MPRCPKCRHRFQVLEDEDDGQHACPSCGYGGHDEDDAPEPLRAEDAHELLAALVDLVRRVDGPAGVLADGSNLDTRQAHAIIAEYEGRP